jgi:histidinol dehydrogenase/sulfopropanediol 3-dehydrogenase
MPTNRHSEASVKYLKKAEGSGAEITDEIRESVREIIDEVRSDGDQGIKSLTRKFDGVDLSEIEVTEAEIEEAKESISEKERAAIDYSIERVKEFAEAQKESLSNDFEAEFGDGIVCGHRSLPIESAGTYVPGGHFTHISSAVMSIVPAVVAGVYNIITCTPPREDGSVNAHQLYAMDQSGADSIYKIGGAQAVAAMTYGTDTVDPVDIVTGPGNVFVVEAKRQVYGEVDLDLLGGPTETLLLVDETTNPYVAAIDLLSQAEHTVSSQCVLISTDRDVADKVVEELKKALPDLETEETARTCWEKNGEIVLAEDVDEATKLADEYAIEHVQVMTQNPREIMDQLHNYGSVFLGHNAPVVFGDKITGPNHILPTAGTARFSGGCNVGSYMKTVTHQEISKEGAENLSEYGSLISEVEGMHGHKLSSDIRPVDRE